MLAVPSAMPSMTPINATPAPCAVDRNIGSSGYIISEEASMKRLTNPRTLTVLLKRLSGLASCFSFSKSGALHYLFPELPYALTRRLERTPARRGRSVVLPPPALHNLVHPFQVAHLFKPVQGRVCLLYTSDAADDLLC